MELAKEYQEIYPITDIMYWAACTLEQYIHNGQARDEGVKRLFENLAHRSELIENE